jgi:hypothetical protein
MSAMSNATHEPEPTNLTRRRFIGQVSALASAGAALCALPRLAPAAPAHAAATPAPPVPATPVVSFYMDRPYLDLSGTAQPYIPPAGTRSGQALAQLGQTESLSHYPYL